MSSLTTLSHELMHQWFGDNVTFGSWNDLWLAEGPARYSEILAAEQVPLLGYTAAQVNTMRTNVKNGALALNANSAWIPDANIGSSSLIWSSSYGSTVYQRGGMVISMLRALSGDTKFFQAMTNYQSALAGRSATADSLKNHFNAVLGYDISEFFRDYVGGSGNGASAVGGVGNPTINMLWNSPATNELAVRVMNQTQSAGSNVTYFNGPVVMHFTNAASGWTKDTTIVIFDWGNGNLAKAGNGLSAPVANNLVRYTLSFTPTHAFYDDSARTLSNGTISKLATLAVRISGIQAYRLDRDIAVEWTVADPAGMVQYEIEASRDGTLFTRMAIQQADPNISTYRWLDIDPVPGDHFYRVLGIGTNGERQYSPVAKLSLAKAAGGIVVYPNPVRDKPIGLLFSGMEKGMYRVRIFNAKGQVLSSQTIRHEGLSASYPLDTGNFLAPGHYQVEFTRPGGSRILKALVKAD